jgi:DNA ligase-4
MTDESKTSGRHLGLVFFDILVLDSEPVLFQPYSTRRQLLEALITTIPTKAIFSDRYKIDMSGLDPSETLQKIFTEHVADHQEGLVLKAEESGYNDEGLPWVKLKKDYIKGFGDCVDLVIVAAGWDRDRARELRGE